MKGDKIMLYNIILKKPRAVTDCFSCPAYNADLKICEGLNKVCFEYDEETSAVIGAEKGEEQHEEN